MEHSLFAQADAELKERRRILEAELRESYHARQEAAAQVVEARERNHRELARSLNTLAHAQEKDFQRREWQRVSAAGCTYDSVWVEKKSKALEEEGIKTSELERLRTDWKASQLETGPAWPHLEGVLRKDGKKTLGMGGEFQERYFKLQDGNLKWYTVIESATGHPAAGEEKGELNMSEVEKVDLVGVILPGTALKVSLLAQHWLDIPSVFTRYSLGMVIVVVMVIIGSALSHRLRVGLTFMGQTVRQKIRRRGCTTCKQVMRTLLGSG